MDTEIAERFKAMDRGLIESERRLLKLLDDRAEAVREDMALETQNRQISLDQMRDSLASDFPQLQQLLVEEATERGAQDLALASAFESDLERLNQAVASERESREANEETMIETFKEMICKIKGEIDAERTKREESDESLLHFLEDTCTKLAVNA